MGAMTRQERMKEASDLTERLTAWAGQYEAYQRENSELLTVIAGKPGGDAFLDALAAYQADRDEWRRKYNRLTDLRYREGGYYTMECEWEQRGIDLAAAEAKAAVLRTALDTIEGIPEYNTTDYEKIRLILAAIKRARAALGRAERPADDAGGSSNDA